jgi:hypothetical protein
VSFLGSWRFDSSQAHEESLVTRVFRLKTQTRVCVCGEGGTQTGPVSSRVAGLRAAQSKQFTLVNGAVWPGAEEGFAKPFDVRVPPLLVAA